MANQKKLYRSQKERVLGGVFGGIAEYFEIDPVIVRLLGVITIFFSGVGVIFYFLAWMVIPDNPKQTVVEAESAEGKGKSGETENAVPFAVGVVLVLFGFLWVADEFNIIDNFSIGFHIFPWRLFWPLVLIFFGVYLLASETSIVKKAGDVRNWARQNRLSKSESDKKLFGVCGGIARQWDLDPTIIRLLFALGTFISFGFGMVFYLVLALILPEDQQTETTSATENKK